MTQINMDTEYTKNIVCPYCGHENRDSWEVNMSEPGIEWDDDLDCGECGETFRASKMCEITYSTRKIEAKP